MPEAARGAPGPRLEDSEIEVVLDAPAEGVARFREVLAKVLAYGRKEALPVRVSV
ncbi:hypothetical protein [Streptomyces sp. NPDC088812]|uniref:hypothetical protein n=1 Tax=Streptomyces sp. NPDC088812 TaxID=3365905 RepID=UPI00380E963C